jgi:hypothetical protein
MEKLQRYSLNVMAWGGGVLLPIFLVVVHRRALAVAVLAAFAVLLLVGWRWRAFLWWAIAGLALGVGLGLLVGWQISFAGRDNTGDQPELVFLLTIPAGIAVGFILAGLAFRRWDPRAR